MRQLGATLALIVDLTVMSSVTTASHFAGHAEVTVSPLISVAAFVGGLPPGGGGGGGGWSGHAVISRPYLMTSPLQGMQPVTANRPTPVTQRCGVVGSAASWQAASPSPSRRCPSPGRRSVGRSVGRSPLSHRACLC